VPDVAGRREPQCDIHIREAPIQVQDQAPVPQVAKRQRDIDGEKGLAYPPFPAGNRQQRRLPLEQRRSDGRYHPLWGESRRLIAPESHFVFPRVPVDLMT
jgi:hypothetical protein